MKIRNYFAQKIFLPLSDILLGQSVAKHLRFLQKSQWWSREQIDEYQNNKLRTLIEHSVSTVPYYSDLFRKLNLTASDIKTKSDLHKIPILTKAAIKKYGQEYFLSTSYPKNITINSSSSGSTGEPLFYKNTKEAYSMNIAANLRGWSWMSFQLKKVFINCYKKLNSN